MSRQLQTKRCQGKMMRISNHAKIRMKQRGFNEEVLDIVWKYGRPLPGINGAEKLFFGNREYKKTMNELKIMIKQLERARNCMIIQAEGNVVTVYNKK